MPQSVMPLRRVLLSGAAAVALAGSAAAGAAESRGVAPGEPALNALPRVALVIGNSAYESARLANPVNDARAMEQALARLGFTVTALLDADAEGMKRAIRTFGRALQRGGVGLFYYAGHGMQVGGRNYLIPVGADIRSEDEVEYEAVDAGRVLSTMKSAANPLNIVILDACRNNPFARSFRSSAQGLAQMDAPVGSVVAYATAPGRVAADGAGEHGVYTAALLAEMGEAGVKLEEVFKRVRARVRRETGGEQVPWELSSLEGDFYFAPRDIVSATPAPEPTGQPGPEVVALVAACEAHYEAKRLTTGHGGNAADCYAQVLKRDHGNARALAGLARIAQRYEEWAVGALGRGEYAKARRYVERLARVSPEHPRVQGLEGEIARAQAAKRNAEETRRAQEARRRAQAEAQARRKAEEEEVFRRPVAEAKARGMVRIRGGCFQMGSPKSEKGRSGKERRHRVCVEDFSIGKYEVTRGEYAAFVRATGRAVEDGCWTFENEEWKERLGRNWRSPWYTQEDTHPVVCVSHGDAQAYARWLSGETGKGYRLPTEAQWEYAARAGTDTSRHWGDDPSKACAYANVADRTAKERYSGWSIHQCRDGYVHTAPVGSHEANGYGLHDMLGNVWEWTCSGYDEDYDGGSERRCAKGSVGRAGRRVVRGGSWGIRPGGVRSADRIWSHPGLRSDNLGFRLAQD